MFSDEEEGRSFKDEEWPKRPAQTMGNMKCVRVFVGGGGSVHALPLSLPIRAALIHATSKQRMVLLTQCQLAILLIGIS